MTKPERIALDFSSIPFENHEAKILAIAYLREHLALENLVAAVGTLESGGMPATRLKQALTEARLAVRT